MANRVKDILRFVTVEHPERYLPGVAAQQLRSKPHYKRPRALSNWLRQLQQERDGFEIHLQPMDDRERTIRRGHGRPIEQYRGKSILGKQLLPFMNVVCGRQPMLVYVPDDVAHKSKWKCELRTLEEWRFQLEWHCKALAHPDAPPDLKHKVDERIVEAPMAGFDSVVETMRLDTNDSTKFWETLQTSTLRVCGLWVNPTYSGENNPNNRAVNLVLGPGYDLPPADLEILAEAGRCWIQYTAQLDA
jgi:hypothetical protein